MRILIVEDEIAIADAIFEMVKRGGYLVDVCYDGNDGYLYAATNIYDLLILDLMLPSMSGIEIIAALRAKGIKSKILILSAKDEIKTKVLGLEIGADDYLTKPFSRDELLARIKAILRRDNTLLEKIYSYGDLQYNDDKKEISTTGKTIKLPSKEANLLLELIKTPGIVINKEKLYYKIWGYDTFNDYNSIEVYITFLRRKIREVGSSLKIKTLRNVGYYLEASV